MVETMADGSPGHELHDSIAVRDGDLCINKYRYGAFVDGSSDLHRILTEKGVDTVIVSGTLTNVCCESTARDAMMLNYRVFFVSDSTATTSDEEHNATLSTMMMTFADVVTTEEVTELLRHGRG